MKEKNSEDENMQNVEQQNDIAKTYVQAGPRT